MQKNRGFTLIELLVVISIIALLLSILAPALRKVKSLATRAVCASRIRQQYLGISVYSYSNEDFVPTSSSGYWLWDMSFWSTNEISRYAGFDDNEIFFCPSNKMKKHDDARIWQFTWADSLGANLSGPVELGDESTLTDDEQRDNYRVLPMIYMFDRYNEAGNSILPATLQNGKKAKWIRKLPEVKNPGSKIMIMDTVISERNDWNFFYVLEGGMADLSNGTLWDTTNHRSNRTIHSRNGSGPQPEGANIGFADGHVAWRKFEDMEHQITWEPWFWW
jgi:prepilin-type N-terminal cleavage/methylation domain-containing protein/prepilin-type processing-associated H-X9-DG protein